MMTPQPAAQPSRRSVLGMLGAVPLASAGVLAATPTIAAAAGHPSRGGGIPEALRPGGVYDRYLKQLAATDTFSGTVLVAHQGRTVLARAYGMADKERSIPNKTATIYNLASSAKPFTGLAIVQLAQQGKLRFYETIGTYLDGFPDDVGSQVRVHHLLTHTSGLGDSAFDMNRTFNSIAEETADQREKARQLTLLSTPGTARRYSGAGYDILGEIVATVSGTAFQEYVHEHIFRPAGMTSSAYYTRPQWLSDQRIAHPYIYQVDGTRFDGLRHPDKGAVLNVPGSNPARSFVGSAGGGGFSSAPDLVRFALALQSGKLLNKPFTELYVNGKVSAPPPPGFPDDPTRPEAFQAYGPNASIYNNQRIITHGGGVAGAQSNWSIYLDTDWVGIILSNYDLTISIGSIIDQERRAVAGTIP